MNKHKQSNSNPTESNSTSQGLAMRLRTIRQLSEECPAFSESAIRWLVFNAKAKGFESAVFHVGRRVLIDIEAFDRWLKY